MPATLLLRPLLAATIAFGLCRAAAGEPPASAPPDVPPSATDAAAAHPDVDDVPAFRVAPSEARFDAHPEPLAAMARLGDGPLRRQSVGWQWHLSDPATTLAIGDVASGGGAQRPLLPIFGVRYGSTSVTGSSATRPAPYAVPRDAIAGGGSGIDAGSRQMPALMSAGRTEFSVEAGALASAEGRLVADREPVMAGGLRVGLSPTHTLSATGTASNGSGLVGVSSQVRLGGAGVVQSGVALLRRQPDAPARARWTLGHELKVSNVTTVVRAGFAPSDRPSATVLQGPTAAMLPTDRRLLRAAASASIGEGRTIDADYAAVDGLDGVRSVATALTARYRPKPGSSLSLGVRQSRAAQSATALFVSFTMPVDGGLPTAASALAARSSTLR